MNYRCISYSDVDLITNHVSNPEPVDYEAESKALWDKLTPDEKAHNDLLGELAKSFKTITGTNTLTDQTEEYFFAEHANIGPGWMMMRVSNPHLGIVSSFNLRDVVGHTRR